MTYSSENTPRTSEQRNKSPRSHDWTGPTRINKYVHCAACGKIFEVLKAKGSCPGMKPNG